MEFPTSWTYVLVPSILKLLLYVRDNFTVHSTRLALESNHSHQPNGVRTLPRLAQRGL